MVRGSSDKVAEKCVEKFSIFPKSYLRNVNKSAQAVRQKYVSSSFIFTMCLNSYYILEEVFLNITDEIFSNFLFILAVRSRSE